ncbi:MAG: ATP phosphoribosyltransferase [Pirellulaceae bacterium]
MRLKIAIQKSGRLSEDSLELLQKCGITFAQSKNKLFCYGRSLPLDLLCVRDDDIPQMLQENVCQLAIVGQNAVREFEFSNGQVSRLQQLRELNYCHCRFSLAVPETFDYQGPQSLAGMRIATSYPATLQDFLNRKGVKAKPVKLAGSVEIAPQLGTADFIADIVSTGTTLKANHLREVETINEIQAALYRNADTFSDDAEALVDKLLKRIDGVQQAAESKYVMLHAPRSAVHTISELLPGAESPTVLPLEGDDDKVAVHAVCREAVFWDHIEELRDAGASAVLVLPIEKMLG